MSRAAVVELIDRWMNDLQFKEELRKDPEEAVRRSGAELDAEEWKMLRNMDWAKSAAELELQRRNNTMFD